MKYLVVIFCLLTVFGYSQDNKKKVAKLNTIVILATPSLMVVQPDTTQPTPGYTPPNGFDFFILSNGDTLKTNDNQYFLVKE